MLATITNNLETKLKLKVNHLKSAVDRWWQALQHPSALTNDSKDEVQAARCMGFGVILDTARQTYAYKGIDCYFIMSQVRRAFGLSVRLPENFLCAGIL